MNCTELAVLSYHGLVASNLSTGIEIWGSASIGRMNKLLKIQKKSVRAILKLGKTSSCREVFKKLKVFTIICLYVYKILLYAKNEVDKYITLTRSQLCTPTPPEMLAN